MNNAWQFIGCPENAQWYVSYTVLSLKHGDWYRLRTDALPLRFTVEMMDAVDSAEKVALETSNASTISASVFRAASIARYCIAIPTAGNRMHKQWESVVISIGKLSLRVLVIRY